MLEFNLKKKNQSYLRCASNTPDKNINLPLLYVSCCIMFFLQDITKDIKYFDQIQCSLLVSASLISACGCLTVAIHAYCFHLIHG